MCVCVCVVVRWERVIDLPCETCRICWICPPLTPLYCWFHFDSKPLIISLSFFHSFTLSFIHSTLCCVLNWIELSWIESWWNIRVGFVWLCVSFRIVVVVVINIFRWFRCWIQCWIQCYCCCCRGWWWRSLLLIWAWDVDVDVVVGVCLCLCVCVYARLALFVDVVVVCLLMMMMMLMYVLL